MSDLHKKLSHAFIQITSYIEEGNQAKGFEMFERIVNAEAKQDAWTQHMNVSMNNAWYIVELEIAVDKVLSAVTETDKAEALYELRALRRGL